MALTPSDRQQIFTRLAPVIGEQEAETLLEQFPSSTDGQPVTGADLNAVEARLDHRVDLVEARLVGKLDGLEARLVAKIDDVETRLDGKIDGLKTRLDGKIDGLKTRLDGKIDGLETRLDGKIEILRRDMNIGFERFEKVVYKHLWTQTILMVTTIVAVLGLVARTNLFG